MPETLEKPISLAYIVSQYPNLSMIFVTREVLQLRALGFNIDVASVNATDRDIKGLTDYEADESAITYYIKPHGIAGALRAHSLTLLRQPRAYLRGWGLVFKLAKLDLTQLFYNIMYLSEALMVGVWMGERQQPHLHAHLGSQAATVALFAKKIFGIGFSMTVHGPDEFYNVPGQYLTAKVKAADFICCISHFACSQLMKLSPYEHWHKLVLARLGVDPSIFSPRPFNSSPDIYEIICVGRLTPAKGQHILVAALHTLLQKGLKVRLRIVGDGPDRGSLEQQVRKLDVTDQVIFEGAVNQDRIRALYALADIFSIPSFAEGIPVVLMEAMAMEIPCVTTCITGIPELIRNEKDGLLVAPSDVQGLANALERLITDRPLREMLGKNGRKRVMEKYNLERNVDRLAEVFSARIRSN